MKVKLLTVSQFNELKAKADSFDAIVNAMVGNSEDVKPEEVTSEVVIQALQGDGTENEDSSSGLQASLDAANERITELEDQLTASNSRVQELEKDLDENPAEQPATITAKAEASGEKQDIVDFATKNADNPFAVIDEAEKQGLL